MVRVKSGPSSPLGAGSEDEALWLYWSELPTKQYTEQLVGLGTICLSCTEKHARSLAWFSLYLTLVLETCSSGLWIHSDP